jgi:hypothetical protein
MIEEDKVISKARAIERLYNNKDFQEAILDDFITNQRLSLTKGFEANMDQIEGLKAIAFFENYLIQSLEEAKMILQERKENG